MTAMATVVPALVLGKRLGKGHFGEVFLGEDGVHGVVAVKVLARKPEDTEAEWHALRTSFLTEAQHLSKARHRNVVQVHHIDEPKEGECIRFCMAYCPGGSLQSAFEKGPMSLLRLRKVATEVTLGLEALHSRGMLHRDIKPGNILIDGFEVAQLGDFGLVTDDLILGYGSQAGYSDHIAFEVWSGSGTSVKSDIWALGMTLYRLLHGQTWYEAAIDAPRSVVQDGKFVEELKWLPHVPKAWRRLIRKMLNDDPALRYQSASQVLNALSALPTPGWTTEVAGSEIRWELVSTGRRKVVLWQLHSARRHEWKAWSEPTARGGRKMSLAGSNGVVQKSLAIKQLEHYFTT